MGRGIAQLCAQSGFPTLLYELNPTVLQQASVAIDKSLDQAVEKKRISLGDKEKTLQRLTYTSDLQSCLADFFIEAIIEQAQPKIDLFNQLAELNHSECIFASNTSSLSITELAKAINHPQRVIGLHFFNPAPLMKLVEVVSTALTNSVTAATVHQLAGSLNKVAVTCQDAPGFIVNHVARPYYIEPLRLLEEGHTSLEQADRLLEATGFKMGPFRLMDLIGNDINYAVSCSVYEQLGRPVRLQPSFLQQQKVQEGLLGKKTGRGYYTY